jgi:nicotinamidase-related amidase
MDKKIKVLVGIDLQNDFIDGSLANKAAQAVIDNIVEKMFLLAQFVGITLLPIYLLGIGK